LHLLKLKLNVNLDELSFSDISDHEKSNNNDPMMNSFSRDTQSFNKFIGY